MLHTIPLGGIIWYNNTTDIDYDDQMDLACKILFVSSGIFNLIEIVMYYIYKASGENIERDVYTQKNTVKKTTV